MGFSDSLQAVLQNGREEDLKPLLRSDGPGSFAVCQIYDTPAVRGQGGYYGSTPVTIEYARRHSNDEAGAQRMMLDPNEKKIRVLYTIEGGTVLSKDIKMAKIEQKHFTNLVQFYKFLKNELQLPISKYCDRASNYRSPGNRPFVNW